MTLAYATAAQTLSVPNNNIFIKFNLYSEDEEYMIEAFCSLNTSGAAKSFDVSAGDYYVFFQCVDPRYDWGFWIQNFGCFQWNDFRSAEWVLIDLDKHIDWSPLFPEWLESPLSRAAKKQKIEEDNLTENPVVVIN